MIWPEHVVDNSLHERIKLDQPPLRAATAVGGENQSPLVEAGIDALLSM